MYKFKKCIILYETWKTKFILVYENYTFLHSQADLSIHKNTGPNYIRCIPLCSSENSIKFGFMPIRIRYEEKTVYRILIILKLRFQNYIHILLKIITILFSQLF